MPPAHPSSRPYGRNPRRRRARPAASGRHQWTDAEPLLCVAQPGKRIIAVEQPGTRRARVVREVVRCIRPIARAASAAYGFRPSFVDGRGAFVVRRAVGEENHRSGTARNAPGASGALHPSNRPGGEHGLRLQAVLNGRTQRLSVSRAAGKVRDTRDGVLRLRHIRPVARAGGIHGGERGLRLQAVIGGRRRSLCRASRGRGRESSQWNRPERAGREWYAASVQLSGRAARLAASGRHWWTDAEPLPCVAQPGKRIIAVELPGARRARVVRCIRPIARAGSTACGFRPSSMDGREDFP